MTIEMAAALAAARWVLLAAWWCGITAWTVLWRRAQRKVKEFQGGEDEKE